MTRVTPVASACGADTLAPCPSACESCAALVKGSGVGSAVDLADGDAALVSSKRDSVAAGSLGCPDHAWRVVLVSASTLACCWGRGKRRSKPHAASNQQCVSGTAEQTRLGQGDAQPTSVLVCCRALHVCSVPGLLPDACLGSCPAAAGCSNALTGSASAPRTSHADSALRKRHELRCV